MVATDIWKKVNPLLTPFLYSMIKLIGKPPLQGAETSIYLATSPDVNEITGKYFVDHTAVSTDPITYDTAIAHRLWEVSSELVGI
jgi:hypothetical protein